MTLCSGWLNSRIRNMAADIEMAQVTSAMTEVELSGARSPSPAKAEQARGRERSEIPAAKHFVSARKTTSAPWQVRLPGSALLTGNCTWDSFCGASSRIASSSAPAPEGSFPLATLAWPPLRARIGRYFVLPRVSVSHAPVVLRDHNLAGFD